MSKFRIKADLDGTVKILEFDRGSPLVYATLKGLVEAKFGEKAVGLKYKSSDGKVVALYQDFHLTDALKDMEKSGSKDFFLAVNREGGSRSTDTAELVRRPSFSGPVASTPAASNPPAASNRPAFCESCGGQLAPAAKFCSSCGHSNAPSSSGPSPGKSNSLGCAGCGNALGGASLKALDKAWHKDCFVCNQCKKSLLSTSFLEDGGLPFCTPCYDAKHGKKCTKCGNVISGAYLNIEGKEYHKACFVCNSCGGPFETGYFMKDGKPTCRNCV